MTKSATRVAADEVSAPIASPVFTGNVGVGVTPANNATPASGLQVGATASIGAWESGSNIITTIGSNSYFNSTYKYITTNTAALIRLINGAINFNVAPSGTADSAISWTTAMTIDNTGAVTMPNQPSFNAKGSSTLSNIAINTVITVPFATERFDVGSNYSTSTHKFTAPVAGKYLFHVYLRLQNVDASSGYYQVYCETTNSSLEVHIYDSEALDLDPTYWTSTGTTVAHMDANDTAHITLYQAGGQAQTDIQSNSTFYGYLIG
jgi:hypothetical protein